MKYFFLILLLPALSHALETDNYIVWNKELKDASKTINSYFQSHIEEVVKETNKNGNKASCLDMTQKIAKVFKSFLVHDNPVENWLMEHLDAGKNEIYPQNLNYVYESIYQDPYRFYIPYFGLAPNIQVNGYYFGTDKLSHFASTGMRYFKQYLKSRKQGLGEEAATKNAIDWGILDENRVHGYWASGVFSFADLEANYQGFLFYRRICHDHTSPYLKRSSDGSWKVNLQVNIDEYVNGNWDETYLLSYRLPDNWESVSNIIQDKYCHMSSKDSVAARMNYYRSTSAESFSMKYITNLQNSNAPGIPRPERSQSVSKLCL